MAINIPRTGEILSLLKIPPVFCYNRDKQSVCLLICGVNAMSKVRAHLVVSGRVQGVYFRAETREQAAALCLTGWVKNKPDRSVEVVAEGSRDDVEKLIEWCRQGPPGAEVTGMSVAWENYTGEFTKFKITF